MTDNKLEQAARQALEALVWETGSAPELIDKKTMGAITALRKALAEQADCPHEVSVSNEPLAKQNKLRAMRAQVYPLLLTESPFAKLAEQNHSGEAANMVSTEWKPCMKLPIVVHVREQREGESHVSTREGITPGRPDDLIMRGVAGEEYPIGRELFNKTYKLLLETKNDNN